MMVDRLQQSIFGALQEWLQAHPTLQWLLTHPLYTIGLFLLSLFLISGLLSAMVRLTEQIWLALLNAPFKLGGWLLSLGANLFRVKSAAALPQAGPPPNPQERLGELLIRLETLRQEEDQLLQEVKTILALEQQLVNCDREAIKP